MARKKKESTKVDIDAVEFNTQPVPLDEVVDQMIGKEGTPERNEFEKKLHKANTDHLIKGEAVVNIDAIPPFDIKGWIKPLQPVPIINQEELSQVIQDTLVMYKKSKGSVPMNYNDIKEFGDLAAKNFIESIEL